MEVPTSKNCQNNQFSIGRAAKWTVKMFLTLKQPLVREGVVLEHWLEQLQEQLFAFSNLPAAKKSEEKLSSQQLQNLAYYQDRLSFTKQLRRLHPHQYVYKLLEEQQNKTTRQGTSRQKNRRKFERTLTYHVRKLGSRKTVKHESFLSRIGFQHLRSNLSTKHSILVL